MTGARAIHQGDGWDVRRHSPLLEFTDSTEHRARFSIASMPPRDLDHVDHLLAGAAEVDITPPPGMPKAGYSANAHDGTGFRSRLRARVLHLRSGEASVALVQCDLLGGSAVLQHLVARAVAETTDVPLAGLLIGATHTHAGPGQFLGSDFYNRFASNRSGFDPAFTQFLVEQIAAAVQEAHDTRGPARLGSGRVDVWGSTRNRSLGAYVQNATVDHRTSPERKFYAINPALHLLRVDRLADDDHDRKPAPLAAMVVFSVHGTGVPMQAREYNADIWAYLVGELGDRIEAAAGTRPVVGAVEGTHADVAPAIHPGRAGHLEAARVGRTVGARAAALWSSLGSQLTDRVPLATGFREVDMERNRTIESITLPYRPAIGAALLAGAYENETPVVHRIPPFKADHPKPWAGRAGNPHGPKWVVGSRWLQPLLAPRKGFPLVLPVQTIRIGGALLVGLPFEITVESGRRIASAVQEAVADDGTVDEVVVSSVANEYAGYIASPEEYERQFYEGAHTIYGSQSQPFLAAHAAKLAAETLNDTVVQDVTGVRSFDLRIHHHLPTPFAPPTSIQRTIDGPPVYVDATGESDGCWQVSWLDVAPGGLDWHRPLVRIERQGTGADHDQAWRPFVDDQGSAVQVTHDGPDDAAGDDRHRYTARWWDPSFEGGRSFRFVLVANRGRPAAVSPPFP
jgi:neutral ceramidase